MKDLWNKKFLFDMKDVQVRVYEFMPCSIPGEEKPLNRRPFGTDWKSCDIQRGFPYQILNSVKSIYLFLLF